MAPRDGVREEPELSRHHLLAQADLRIADLDDLAVQLTLALDGPLLLAFHNPPPPTARRVGSLEDTWQTLVERLCFAVPMDGAGPAET
ncbi:MAG: hypothetical protein ACRYG2_08830 [Janthinobacterium lividum]